MKRTSVLLVFGFLLLLLSLQLAQAQDRFGNGWVDYAKRYYKMQATEEGIYRITYAELAQVGFPVDAVINPNRYQMYWRGQEIAISVVGQADGSFDSLDYIEFYGVPNDGKFLDRQQYEFPDEQQNVDHRPNYSFPNYYFLTYSNTPAELGKRIAFFKDTNYAAAPLETYHFEKALFSSANAFAFGPLYNPIDPAEEQRGARLSSWDHGEGYTGDEISDLRGLQQYPLPIKNALRLPKLKAKLEVSVVGRRRTSHPVLFWNGFVPADVTSPATDSVVFLNTRIAKIDFEADSTTGFPVGDGNYIFCAFPRRDNPFVRNSVSLNYIKYTYAQALNMRNEGFKVFNLDTASANKSYLPIQAVPAGARMWDVTDYNQIIEIGASFDGTLMRVVVPNTRKSRKVIVDAEPRSVSKLERVVFPKVLPETFDYIIITDAQLRKPSSEYSDPVQAYANYRASAIGGRYKPVVMNVQDLYNLFSYGEPHPLALRRFIDFIWNNNGAPKGVFLVGKGTSTFYQTSLLTPDAVHVPTFGYPSSDYQLIANMGLKPEKNIPSIPIGRLPARTPEEVANYFNKVKEHETTDLTANWRKNILFLSGGLKEFELRQFRSHIENYDRIVKGQYFGANTTLLSKKTTDVNQFDNFNELLNNGQALITFFGHASFELTDIKIGYVTDPENGYRNKGKYPMMIVNGCGAGDIFTSGFGFAEDWMTAKDRGAIAFLSHSHIGFASTLDAYTAAFLQTAFTDLKFLGKPIGEIVQETNRRTLAFSPSDTINIANVQQFVLQGDPMVRLTFLDKPDYHVDDSRVSLRSNTVTPLSSQSDRIEMDIDVSNYGLTDFRNRLLGIQVKRTFPDGSSVTYIPQYFNAIPNRDTVTFSIAQTSDEKRKAAGLNRFEIRIDFEDSIKEGNENNNLARYDFSLTQGGVFAIAPKEFSIQSKKLQTLIAQNSNPFGEAREFIFELDTTDFFNSPLKKDTLVTGFVTTQWTLELPLSRDSTVYFWRVRYANPSIGDDPRWSESSFIYIQDSPEGWSQAHLGQFKKDQIFGLKANRDLNKWEFENVRYVLDIKNVNGIFPTVVPTIKVNGEVVVNGDCDVRWLYALTFSGRTGRLYNPYAIQACGANLLASNLLPTNPREDALKEYISRLESGDYVVLMNGRFADPQTGYPIAELAQIGVDVAAYAANAIPFRPFIIVGRKGGAPGSALMNFAPTVESGEVSLNLNLEFAVREGSITSVPIGPAERWETLFRDIRGLPEDKKESWQLDVIGVNTGGGEEVLLTNIRPDATALRSINPEIYPNIKLRTTIKDSLNGTPFQLRRWQVIYQEVPEGILLYDTLVYRERTDLEVIEGDTLGLGFVFYNISGNDFKDPLRVQYKITNDVRGSTETFDTDITAPKRGEFTQFALRIPSNAYKGKNFTTVFVNPRLQAEQLYDNNILQARFSVKPDDINPVLDVAFDGKMILDGDIVAPAPLISISLKDENKTQIRQDTLNLDLFLSSCDTCTARRIDFSEAGMSWTASPDNNFRIEYTPANPLPDGDYTLRIEAQDLSGNTAGIEPYRVRFKVINRTAISQFYPYPNPFSTSTRFVFTLTGQEVPEQLKIQIMTVSGKVVRTITQDELGPLRIGNNITDFAWDGKDEYGDQLANGVYLYKVFISDSQRNYERFETAQDGLFKHNIGKLYLMR
ncbi:MAG: hypothetical protein EAZ57_03995 [Cytophagales bacterium]|nr:MAG: hypothetical protein EAZ67_05010 [Cytophagales bacterium]TAF61371.1 MAG: hypothetical protein EAZ57_03995 [Cytophagales bacterium]